MYVHVYTMWSGFQMLDFKTHSKLVVFFKLGIRTGTSWEHEPEDSDSRWYSSILSSLTRSRSRSAAGAPRSGKRHGHRAAMMDVRVRPSIKSRVTVAARHRTVDVSGLTRSMKSGPGRLSESRARPGQPTVLCMTVGVKSERTSRRRAGRSP